MCDKWADVSDRPPTGEIEDVEELELTVPVAALGDGQSGDGHFATAGRIELKDDGRHQGAAASAHRDQHALHHHQRPAHRRRARFGHVHWRRRRYGTFIRSSSTSSST